MAPYQEGYSAAESGLSRYNNPYIPGTSNYNEWFRGWYDYFFDQGVDPEP